MNRIGLESILSVKRSVTISIMLNFDGDGDGDGTCKLTFKIWSKKRGRLWCTSILVVPPTVIPVDPRDLNQCASQGLVPQYLHLVMVRSPRLPRISTLIVWLPFFALYCTGQDKKVFQYVHSDSKSKKFWKDIVRLF